MELDKFLKERSNKTGFLEEKDPDIVNLDFNIMKQDYLNGVQVGESTGIDQMDKNLSWMRGHQNCWSGWANDGKTTFLLYLMTVKSLVSGWKWAIWSPEMMKANFIDGKVKKHFNVLAYEIMNILSKRTPYKHIHKKYGVPLLSLDEIEYLKTWIEKHFLFVNPPQRDIKYIMGMHKRIYEHHGFDGFLLDPYKNVQAEIGARDDQHLSNVFAETTERSIETNTVFNWIAHPKGNVSRTVQVGEEIQVAPCNQYMLSGGAAWDNSMDGIYTPLRPYTIENLSDNRVVFYNLKQRMQDLTASRGSVDGIEYDMKTKRYTFDNKDPLHTLCLTKDGLQLIDDIKSFPTNEIPNEFK